jgi:fructokinase
MIICFGEVLMDCLPDKNVIGGAPFNVAINLKRLGNDVQFISQVGSDDFGREIYALAQQEKIEKSITINKHYKTGFVTVEFVDNEPNYTIHKNTAWHFIPEKLIEGDVDYFVFGSLATYFEPNKKVFERYHNELTNATFVCDLNLRAPFFSDDHILFCLEHCDVLKVNENEWSKLLSLQECLTDEDLFQVLFQDYKIDKVILTKGSDGAILIDEKESVKVPVSVIPQGKFQDAIGAGDGFLSSFLDTFIKTKNGKIALQKASTYASLICQNQGAVLSNELFEQHK